MAYSRTTLWNDAINLLGGDSGGIITSVDDTGDVAKWLRDQDQEACDYCVGLFDWLEATAFSEIAVVASAVQKADWEFAYSRPDGFLHIINFTNVDGRRLKVPYELMGKYILSDETPGYIKFVRRMSLTSVADITLMSPALRHLVAKYLGTLVTPVFDSAMTVTAEAKFEAALDEARAVNQNNTFRKPTPWISVRR